MEVSKYTFEKFKEDFENANTPEGKQNALYNLLDSDIDVREYKDDIKEYRAQLQDLKNEMGVEEDASINAGIENGTFKLYECIEDFDQYKKGNRYYAKVDPIKERYTSALVGDGSKYEVPAKIQEYINGLKDLIWIVTDEGIGTLKKKNLVRDFDFSKHFTIFV